MVLEMRLRNNTRILLDISSLSNGEKNEYWLRFGNITAMNLVTLWHRFLDTVYNHL